MQPNLGLRALQAFGSLLGELIDLFTPGSPHPMSQTTRRTADPFSLERARAIDAKAAAPLLTVTLRLGAWAEGRRRAGGRLSGLLAAFGQFYDLGGLRKGFEPFCARRLLRCLAPVKSRLLLSSHEAAVLTCRFDKPVACPTRSPNCS